MQQHQNQLVYTPHPKEEQNKESANTSSLLYKEHYLVMRALRLKLKQSR